MAVADVVGGSLNRVAFAALPRHRDIRPEKRRRQAPPANRRGLRVKVFKGAKRRE